MCAEAGKDIARQFLEQFYAIYDSPNREPLRDAYHESAMLSLSCPPNHQSNRNQGHRDNKNVYVSLLVLPKTNINFNSVLDFLFDF